MGQEHPKINQKKKPGLENLTNEINGNRDKEDVLNYRGLARSWNVVCTISLMHHKRIMDRQLIYPL